MTYTSSDAGLAVGTHHVLTGLSQASILGHTFVIHDITGARIACAMIEARMHFEMTADDFVPYYSYEGNLKVRSTFPVSTALAHPRDLPVATCRWQCRVHQIRRLALGRSTPH